MLCHPAVLLCAALLPAALACDSLGVLPSATADGIGGFYGKNADRNRHEAQPVAAVARATWPEGATITLDSGLVIPQVPLTYGHAGSRPFWAHPYGGYSEGINEFGVGLGNEMFPSHALPTDHGNKPQAEFTDLARLVLERCKTAAEAVATLTELVTLYGQTCRTCPEAADYNSLFMVADTTEVYSVMAVGHEWGWKQLKLGDPLLNGTGVWSISNRYVPGATNISATAIATARKDLQYTGTDAEFDFGMVYGDQDADPSRQQRSAGLLRDLAADHKLTKADLMMTLSDHSYGGTKNAHEPYVAQPHWHGTEIDEHTEGGGISASSMVSDFSTDAANPRKIAWHTGPNPCMAAYYPVIFHHDGHVSELPDYLTSGILWWNFHYSIYDLAGQSRRKIKHVQDTWRPIQQRFFAQAEAAAAQAEGMELVAAQAMLKALMLNISTTLQTTLAGFNTSLPAM